MNVYKCRIQLELCDSYYCLRKKCYFQPLGHFYFSWSTDTQTLKKSLILETSSRKFLSRESGWSQVLADIREATSHYTPDFWWCYFPLFTTPPLPSLYLQVIVNALRERFYSNGSCSITEWYQTHNYKYLPHFLRAEMAASSSLLGFPPIVDSNPERISTLCLTNVHPRIVFLMNYILHGCQPQRFPLSEWGTLRCIGEQKSQRLRTAVGWARCHIPADVAQWWPRPTPRRLQRSQRTAPLFTRWTHVTLSRSSEFNCLSSLAKKVTAWRSRSLAVLGRTERKWLCGQATHCWQQTYFTTTFCFLLPFCTCSSQIYSACKTQRCTVSTRWGELTRFATIATRIELEGDTTAVVYIVSNGAHARDPRTTCRRDVRWEASPGVLQHHRRVG